MAYAQWISVTINSRNLNISIKNAHLAWGKFHGQGNKDYEIGPNEINQIVVAAGSDVDINACGREGSASGTEGEFELYEGSTQIGIFYWNCPWGSKSNELRWTPTNDNYVTQISDGNLDSGAIGRVTLKCAKI